MTHPFGHNQVSKSQIPKCSEIVTAALKACTPYVIVLDTVCSFCLCFRKQEELQQWKKRCEELQIQVQQLREDREELHSRLKGSHAKEGTAQLKLTNILVHTTSLLQSGLNALQRMSVKLVIAVNMENKTVAECIFFIQTKKLLFLFKQENVL